MSYISLNSLLYVARAGMLAQQTGMDVVANNIANVNTLGYKRTRGEFHELLSAELTNEPPDGSNRSRGTASGAFFRASHQMFEQGDINETGQPWDLAIIGDGFFQIQQPDGTTAYTRAGNFRMDGEGQLVDVNGNYLSPEVVIPPDAQETFIASDGTVFVRRLGETEPEEVAQITLARFPNTEGLEPIGNNMYVAGEASGEAIIDAPQTNLLGQLASGVLENSNVSLGQEMVDMIRAQRAYSLLARALQSSDEMLSLASRMRG